jgi:serine/threonine protein kinase
MALARFAVDLSHYTQKSVLGDGSFGRVVEAVDSRTGRSVAIKTIKRPILPEVSEQRAFIRELEILAANDHPCTLRLLGFNLSLNPALGPTLVTEVMTNGTLGDLIKKERSRLAPKTWNSTAKAKCIFGMVVGMTYCHSQGIIHRDLKPDNVFMRDTLEPVIADFGISRYCQSDLLKTKNVGSPIFMAPELMDDDSDYDYEVDVYAFAVTLYSMFAAPAELDDNPRPIRRQDDLFTRVQNGARFKRKPTIPDHYWWLIQQCWAGPAVDRPPFRTLLRNFKDSHEYATALPGVDMPSVIEYENRLFQDFGDPPDQRNLPVAMMTREESAQVKERVERLLASALPAFVPL